MTSSKIVESAMETLPIHIENPDPALIRGEAVRRVRARKLRQRSGIIILSLVAVVGGLMSVPNNAAEERIVTAGEQESEARQEGTSTSGASGSLEDISSLVADLEHFIDTHRLPQADVVPLDVVEISAGEPGVYPHRVELMRWEGNRTGDVPNQYSLVIGEDAFCAPRSGLLSPQDDGSFVYLAEEQPENVTMVQAPSTLQCEPNLAPPALVKLLNGPFNLSIGDDVIVISSSSGQGTFIYSEQFASTQPGS